MNIEHCPSCLKPGFNGFCLPCRKQLFHGRRVSPLLPFSRPDYNIHKRDSVKRLSISGVQSKHSVRLVGTELSLTEEQGEFILKPIMTGALEHSDAMPANEHVTMQLASQIFGITTAACAVVFFSDDFSPAYLTRRFDIAPDKSRYQQEDFAQIAQVTEETHGKNYKYDFSYEKIAHLMKRYVSTYAIEIEKFFRLVIFNYLVQNGDAHLKNFSLIKQPLIGSYLLTPAYDLLNTRIHLPNETAMALDLFDAEFETESYRVNGFHSRDDFTEFGRRIGIPENRVHRIIENLLASGEKVDGLLNRSFLDAKSRTAYSAMVKERLRAVGYSYKNSAHYSS